MEISNREQGQQRRYSPALWSRTPHAACRAWRRGATQVVAVWVATLVMSLGLVPLGHVAARPGDLDPTFGGDGRRRVDLSDNSFPAIALQADGKVVGVGGISTYSRFGFGLVRLQSNGTVDTTFGDAGQVRTFFGSGKCAYAYAVAIQPDGKIVAAGYVTECSLDPAPPDSHAFAIARYHPNGALDTTFGGDGRVQTSFESRRSTVSAVAIQPDGKIVAAGYVSPQNSDCLEAWEIYWYPGCDVDFALARYHPNGTLDTTFGGDGRVLTSLSNDSDHAYAVGIQADGKLVVAGTTYIFGDADFAVARYHSNGTLDTTFNGDGRVITGFGTDRDDEVAALALQPDGKIVVVGDSVGDFAVARYHPNGARDRAFSNNGLVVTPFGTQDLGYMSARAVVLQPDGKLVVAGSLEYCINDCYDFGSDFVLVRYKANGTLDPTFGRHGMVRTSFDHPSFRNGYDTAHGMVLQPDGKLVVVGHSHPDFVLARYRNFSCYGFDVTRLGTAGDDVLIGTEQRNIIYGLGGNDTIYGLGGADVLCGGTDNDILIGGGGNDILIGGGGHDMLIGGRGNDQLSGRGGTDRLNGGPGTDTCDGGLGPADTVISCEAKPQKP